MGRRRLHKTIGETNVQRSEAGNEHQIAKPPDPSMIEQPDQGDNQRSPHPLTPCSSHHELVASTPTNHTPGPPIPETVFTLTRGPLRRHEMICHLSDMPATASARREMHRVRMTGHVIVRP